jgi:hypothetical protein
MQHEKLDNVQSKAYFNCVLLYEITSSLSI